MKKSNAFKEVKEGERYGLCIEPACGNPASFVAVVDNKVSFCKKHLPKLEIFKVQLPLMSSEQTPMALAYNKNRSIEAYMDPRFIEHVMEGPKGYFYCRYYNDVLMVEDAAPWQDW